MAASFTHYRQLDQMDCGPTCLRMIAKHFGKHYSTRTLAEKTNIGRDGVSMLGIAEAAEALGFKAVGVKLTLSKLVEQAPLPCILHWSQDHFLVLIAAEPSSRLDRTFLSGIWGGRKPGVDIDKTSYETSFPAKARDEGKRQSTVAKKYVFQVADPASGILSYSGEEFERKWLGSQSTGTDEGIALLLEPTPRFYAEEGEQASKLRLGQLAGYLWQYKKLIFQLMLGVIVGSSLSLVFPFLTQAVIDVGIGTSNISFLYLILIAQMVLMVSASLVDFMRSWILLHISTRLNLTILSEFLAKLMKLPVPFFDAKHFGDIMQRIGDHNRIETFLTGHTLSTLFSLVNLIVFGFILAWYNLSIFLIAIGASGLYACWITLFLKKRRSLDNRKFELSARSQSQVVQLIHGMQDIRLAGAETLKRWEWERTQASMFKWNVKSLSLSQIQQAGTLFINNGKNIFITFIAAKAVIDGHLSLGSMMSILYILGQFNAPMEQMINLLQTWQDAQISLERLNEVQEMDDEEPAQGHLKKEWDKTSDIELRNISFTYPGAGNQAVLKNINLHILRGKTTAIVGTSGSGKTTLLKLLLRFYEPRYGDIFLSTKSAETTAEASEVNLMSISHSAWRRQCGVVMQEGYVFSDTIARNIAIHDEVIDQQKLFRAARVANIHSFIASLPMGYHTRIGTEGNGISQGQKQRILIARAVYKDPDLLLFDEATNALDAHNEAAILHNLTGFLKNRTVVVVAHRLSTVKNADQIVVLEKGEIVEQGRHHELIALRGKYFELVSNQLELSESSSSNS